MTIENLEKEGYKMDLFLTIMEGDLMRTLDKRKELLDKKNIDYFFICTWDEWTNYLISKEMISPALAECFYKFVENPLCFDEEKLNKYKKDLEDGNIWIGKKN